MFTDKVCRACLCESNEMKALTAKIVGENRTLLDALHFVTNINLITRNGLPKQVCSECESILCKADAFKRRCLESESILTQHFDGEPSGEYLVDLPKSSIIKDEIASEITKSDLFHPSQSSTNAGKSSEPTLDILFENLSEQDDKIKIFADIPVTKHRKNCSDVPKDVLAKGNSTQVVKEEENTEFDSQDDMFDFGQASFDNEAMEYDQKPSKDETKEFTCKCGANFDTKEQYKSHWRTSNCNGYKKSVKIKNETKTTKKTKLEIKKQILCTECNLEFNSAKSFKLHQRKHKDKDDETGNFECTLCMRKFVRKCSYTNHMKQHNLKSNIKYTCETCKRDFQHKAHLDNHVLALHSRDKGFQCEICTTHFATQESLDIHKDSHNVDKKHQCNICKKSFYMLSTLNDHLRVHTGEKPFLCSICGRGFSQKTNLAQHMRRHQGLKPFKCEDCNKRFVSKGELVAHNRKHSGAHPFVCDDCGSGFTTSSSLVKHRRMHTGERPYACDLCSMRFAASGTLKNHRRTHTGEKPFQCSYCEKAFVQRHDLIAHIRGHTGERPYTCGCGQAFRKASALKAHVRLHGKEPQRELSILHTSAILHGANNLSLNNEHTAVQ